MRLLKSFSIYTATSILNSGIAFFLLPVFSKYLTPSDYGTLSYYNVVVSLVFPLILIGFNGAIQVEFYKKSKKELARYIFTGLVLILGILSLLEAFFLGGYLYFNTHIELSLLWWCSVPFLAFFQVLPLVAYTILLNQKRAWIYGLLNIGSALINIVLSLLLVVALDMNWQGRVEALFCTNLLLSAVALLFLKKNGLLGTTFSRTDLKGLLKFGLPLIPHNLGAVILAGTDKILITILLSVADLGVYNVAFQLGMAIFIIESSFFKSFIPYVLENVEKGVAQQKQIVKNSMVFLAGLFGFLVIYSLMQPLVYKWLIDKAYSQGQNLVFWIGFSYWMQAVYKVFVVYLFHVKRTHYLAYLSVLSVILNLGLNLYLIPIYGLMGAAITTIISQVLITIIVAAISNKEYPMPWLSFYRK